MNTSDHFPLPMPGNAMPPIPRAGERGPHVCKTIQLYLAILEDLPSEQAQRVLEHTHTCSACEPVLGLMQSTAQALARLLTSTPSAHVDQAVMQAIAERGQRGVVRQATFKGGKQVVEQPAMARQQPLAPGRQGPVPSRSHRHILGGVGALALAAALVLTLLATLHLGGGPATHAFALPPNLSWNGNVLFHTETRIDAAGERYQVDTYQDMRTGRMHVETIMPGSMDVVVVSDEHAMLGLDMMHHVAQWKAEAWSVDETAFNLAELRSDLSAQRAFYLDKDTFHGQPVYRIRCRNGLVLLLDMHYRPVNVLRSAVGPGTGAAIYNQLALMPSSHIASNMWDMSIPSDFHMGTLPSKP